MSAQPPSLSSRVGGVRSSPVRDILELTPRDARDRTVTISSLSKVLAPGLRIGWLRAPETILRPLAIAKQAADLHTSTVDQIAARTCLELSDLDAHIAGVCEEYRRRRDTLLAGVAAALPAGSADACTLRLSFTTHAAAEIAEGLARLARATAR